MDCTLYGESFINDVTFLGGKKYCNLSKLGFLHKSVTWRRKGVAQKMCDVIKRLHLDNS